MDTGALPRARLAGDARRWCDACDEFDVADPAALNPDDLEAWAKAAYLTGRFETAGTLWADAHHRWLEAGDQSRAIRCAFWLGLTLMLRGDVTRGGAWFGRGGAIAEQTPDDAAAHYLRLPAALQALHAAPAAALDMCRDLARVGDAAGAADLATLGRLGEGQALVALGRADDGVATLDGAMLAVLDDEVSPIVAGIVYCAVILACQEVLDIRRAQQWTVALDEWCRRHQGLQPYYGQCLVHRSQLHQMSGEWSAAIGAAREACDHLAGTDPVQGMAYYQLAELLRLRGEFSDAEQAYRDANRWGHTVQPGLALLRVAEGRSDDAIGALRRVLDEGGTMADQVHASAALVEAALAIDDVDIARNALDRIERATGSIDTPYLIARRDHARGTLALAEHDHRSAAHALDAAKTTWHGLEAPYEGARSATHLGAAYLAMGDRDSAELEWATARRVFTEAGAVVDLARLDAVSGTDECVPGDLTIREAEVLTHVAAGESNRHIAGELVISEHTVRRHLQNIFAKLGVTSRVAATAWAYEHDLIGH